MQYCKPYATFLILVLINIISATPVDSTTTKIPERNTSPTQIAIFYHYRSKFLHWGIDVAIESVGYSRTILDDENLLANKKPEVLEFKQNLTKFVEDYLNRDDVYDIIDIFVNIAEKYLNLSKEPTSESKFLNNLLTKYHVEKIVKKFEKDFLNIEDDLTFLFLLEKENLDKPLLDWLENLKATNSLGKKIEYVNEFYKMSELKI